MSDSPTSLPEAAAAASMDGADAGLFPRRGGAKKKLADEDERRAPPAGDSQPPARGQGDPSLEYSMKHEKRGYCVIFNQVRFHPETRQSERAGSDVDADSLERTFRKLQFDVMPFRNLTCSEILQVVRDLAAKNHSDCDCMAIVVLSHGENGCVYGSDGKLSLEKMAQLVRPDNCPTLAGKPKLIFIQACRGSKFDPGHSVYEATDGDSDQARRGTGKVSRIPLESDFLFFYSTPPGYYSWRNDAEGSWFAQQLCRVLNEYGEQIELGHLLLTVQRQVSSEYQSRTGDSRTSSMRQIPVTVSTLRKLLYFRRK